MVWRYGGYVRAGGYGSGKAGWVTVEKEVWWEVRCYGSCMV